MTTGPSASLADGSRSPQVPRRGDDGEPAGSPPTSPADRPGGDQAVSASSLEISNAMVRLYKETFGRGPTKARTTFAWPDTVVVVLEDVFTVAERSLLSLGEMERLRQSRLLVQDALEPLARSTVESALGRQTRAFITGIDPHRDVAINVFTLEPAAVEDGRQDRATSRARSAR